MGVHIIYIADRADRRSELHDDAGGQSSRRAASSSTQVAEAHRAEPDADRHRRVREQSRGTSRAAGQLKLRAASAGAHRLPGDGARCCRQQNARAPSGGARRPFAITTVEPASPPHEHPDAYPERGDPPMPQTRSSARCTDASDAGRARRDLYACARRPSPKADASSTCTRSPSRSTARRSIPTCTARRKPHRGTLSFAADDGDHFDLEEQLGPDEALHLDERARRRRVLEVAARGRRGPPGPSTCR